jgi:hypothetical protein
MTDRKSEFKTLVILTYPTGWQWGLCLEYINDNYRNQEIQALDLSFTGNFLISNKISKYFGKYKFRKKVKKYLTQRLAVKFVDVSNKSFKLYILRILKKLNPIDVKDSSIYNTLIEKSQNLDLTEILRNPKGKFTAYLEFKKSYAIRDVLNRIDKSKLNNIVVVNGRFTKCAEVLKWAKENSIQYKILEFGNLQTNCYEIYNVSPHSMSELQEKINNFWNESVDAEKAIKSQNYLTNIEKNRTTSPVNFVSKMVENEIPKSENKKICVFYASTETEYAGVSDPVNEKFFQNQVEAFESLTKLLDSDEWIIYLRRHPKRAGDSGKDGEAIIWNKFAKHHNVKIIEPTSPIDSIALGMKADLITSYWSTINIEFLIRGKTSVLNFGPTGWSQLLPELYIRNEEELHNFLTSPIKFINIKKLYPWAYFTSEFGQEFKIVKTDPKTGVWRID